MHGRELIQLQSDSRDMSFVRVSHATGDFWLSPAYINSFLFQFQLLVDKYANQRRRAPEFELQDFYGQILRFLVVDIPDSQAQADLEIETGSLAYAVIRQINLLDEIAGGIKYYKDLGPIIFVDLNQVKCVIGRVMDRGKWAIIDRCTNTFTREHVCH